MVLAEGKCTRPNDAKPRACIAKLALRSRPRPKSQRSPGPLARPRKLKLADVCPGKADFGGETKG
eukprot:4481827-Pyramimonas_sp.AAC.1